MKNQFNEKGQLHGYWEFKDGYKSWKGYFINNKSIGLWKKSNENGNISEMQFYSL